MNKTIIKEASKICEDITNAIIKRNNGLNCKTICPGQEALVKITNRLVIELKDIEPECSQHLNRELQNLRTSTCVNPYSFGGITAIINILKMQYLDGLENKSKLFISHCSSDKDIVNGFIKEILKIGCGFKDDEIFCTLDSTCIKTGDDFRDKIIKNMRSSDYILLFISENYNLSDVCKNEMGAAWALEGKRILPFVLPNISFEQMGFLNVVKQGASITDKNKLDEFYQELCCSYNINPNWLVFNKAKEDFINLIQKI